MNFNIFGGFQKNKYFLGKKSLWIYFFWEGEVITTLYNNYGSFLCILESFLNVKVQNVGYFLGLLKFQIFFFWGA